jgi:hypothetical protein
MVGAPSPAPPRLVLCALGLLSGCGDSPPPLAADDQAAPEDAAPGPADAAWMSPWDPLEHELRLAREHVERHRRPIDPDSPFSHPLSDKLQQRRFYSPPDHGVIASVGAADVVTHARPLLLRATTADELRVVIHWAHEEHRLGQRIQWWETLASLKVHVDAPSGRTATLTVGPIEGRARHTSPGRAYAMPSMLLTLTSDGLDTDFGAMAWHQQIPAGLFRSPGRYAIVITGDLVLHRPHDPTATRRTRESRWERIPFATGPMTVDLVRPRASFRTVAALERRAAAAVRARTRKIVGTLSPSMPIVDTPAGNRIVRFRFRTGEYTREAEYDVEVAPSGRIVAVESRIIYDADFRCVAHGTSVATEHGPRPVEELAVGDQVWAFDRYAGRTLLTPVRAIHSAIAPQVIEVDGRLRLTAHHPVLADGEWQAAGHLAPGAALLTEQLVAHTVTHMGVIPAATEVFSLEVGWPHNYFAAGFLVHNKRPAIPRDRGRWFELWSHLDRRN